MHDAIMQLRYSIKPFTRKLKYSQYGNEYQLLMVGCTTSSVLLGGLKMY